MEDDPFDSLWFDDDDEITHTSMEQVSCEKDCSAFLHPPSKLQSKKLSKKMAAKVLLNEESEILLARDQHVAYLYTGLANLSSGYVTLDASRPWIIYWVVHSLVLLGESLPDFFQSRIIETLNAIQNSSSSSKPLPLSDGIKSSPSTRFFSGGFGGGMYQLSHGAPNYAAVLALCSIGSPSALQSIDRPAMYRYFLSMKNEDGSFRMHADGESDTRGVYTILSTARILNLLTPELTRDVGDYILRCQTYEGGFGGEPFNEAHGGYNFCALASLFILHEQGRCNLKRQESWLLQRQMRLEGGFQGRTNKLVDSCYSFWQGAALAIVELIKGGGHDLSDVEGVEDTDQELNLEEGETVFDLGGAGNRLAAAKDDSGDLPFNQRALQQYILHCAQEFEKGGLKDKPSKSRDYYHSCYALSGLSVAQYAVHGEMSPMQVFGDYSNLLKRTSIVYNVEVRRLKTAIQYFSSFGTPDHKSLKQST